MEEKFTKDVKIDNSDKQIIIKKKVLHENAVLLSCLGTIWLIAGLTGMTSYPEISILILFSGLSMFNPIMKYVRKSLKFKSGNPLKLLITCITIGVPAGVIVGFFPFSDNINLFFPAFSILLALIFGVVYYAFRIKMHMAMAVILLAGSAYISYSYQADFAVSGLFTGASLMTFGLISKSMVVLKK
ncbi:MAG: hypothetical protein ACK4ND_08350 [Cytophagaceae bacterium]